MAYTQADLDALRAAMAKGVRKVKMGDEEVEYRSQRDMERMEAKMVSEISGTSKSRAFKPMTSSGWR